MPPARATQQDRPDELVALDYIRRSVQERGYPPSQRELAAACGWRSPSSSSDLLRVLESRGLVKVAPGIPRAIQITEAGMAALIEQV